MAVDHKPKTRLPTSLNPVSRGSAMDVIVSKDNIVIQDALNDDSSDFRDDLDNSEAETRFSRLREAVRRAGGNKIVASRSKIPLSTLGDYIAGGEWKFSAALALSKACDVSLEWLATGTEFSSTNDLPARSIADDHRNRGSSTVPSDGNSISPYIAIPRYEVRASAGPGSSVEEEKLIGTIAIDEEFLRHNLGRQRENLVSIYAAGDSMDPTIRDGDLLIVDTSVKDIQNSRIFVIEVNGLLLVKRIQIRIDGSLLIKSDNIRYEAEIISSSDRSPLRIIGQVVYQAGPVRS